MVERLVSSMNNKTKEIMFLVQGSSPEPYRVKFQKSTTSFTAHCSCPAGQNGMQCKHRLNILMGLTDAIISNNVNEVEIIQGWLANTPTDEAMQSLANIDKQYSSIKKALSKAKKNLSKAFRGESF